MGIRFFCPNGHKMNVKAFLAGKRGICPKCGAKVDIPLESVAAPAPPVMSHAGSSKPASPAATPNPSPLTPSTAKPATPGMPSAPGWQAPVGGFSAPTVAFAAGGVAPHVAQRAAPAVPAPLDPISEAPAAMWYVRPAAGGQYGPAPGPVMRQWIDERRVGADSMVWREGWSDWRRATVAFPSLSQQMPTSAAPHVSPAAPLPQPDDDWMDAIVESGPTHPNVAAHVHHKRKPQNNVILIVGIVAILVGIIVLALIIRQVLQERKSERSAAPAATTTASYCTTHTGSPSCASRFATCWPRSPC